MDAFRVCNIHTKDSKYKKLHVTICWYIIRCPSSLKTVIVELFRLWKNSYYTDNFSPKSFISHYAGIKEEQLKKIDMLPKIKDKFFLCSELSPMFAKKEDELNEIIA